MADGPTDSDGATEAKPEVPSSSEMEMHTAQNLGVVYEREGMLEEAEAMYKRALDFRERV